MSIATPENSEEELPTQVPKVPCDWEGSLSRSLPFQPILGACLLLHLGPSANAKSEGATVAYSVASGPSGPTHTPRLLQTRNGS